MAWIKWDDLLRSKSEGGLGFLNLQSFNTALLCKWLWRFISPEDCLWKRLIVSRHGEPQWSISGPLTTRLRKPSTGWWRNIISLVDGEKGNWFWSLLHRRLGDGKSTKFWDGAWLGSSSLKSQYPHLFHLSTNQEATVNDMGSWENRVWKWNISWKRDLRDSEHSVAATFLERLTIAPSSASMPDRWDWLRKPSNVSLVRHMYSTLEARRRSQTMNPLSLRNFSLIWSTSAPLKAQMHGWRLCKNRLPTFDNLRRRIDLNGADPLCCFCRVYEESCAHLFLECTKVRNVWANFLSWIGFSWAPPNSLHDHFYSFASLRCGKKYSRIFGGLWICVVWVWWKWRNAIVFEKKEWNIHRITDEIKCRFWSWCVVRGQADSRISFEAWKRSPNFLL